MLISSVWRARTRWVFGLGLVTGALTVAMLASVLAALFVQWWLPEPVAATLVVLAVSVSLLHELRLVKVPLPQNARQVPELILQRGPLAGPLQFGFEMGTGMRTFMTSALPHVALLSVVLLAGPLEAAAAGVGFGLGRALVPTAGWLAGDDWSEVFDRHARTVQPILAVAVCVALGGVLMTTGWGG